MVLRYIERGTNLQIKVKMALDGEDAIYDATFYDLYDIVNETSFIVQCSKLNRDYGKLDQEAMMSVSFTRGEYIYTLSGRASGKMYTDMVVIDMIGGIEETNRRTYERDEIRVEVKVYGLPEDQIPEAKYMKPIGRPALTDMSFDISSGGLSIISNIVLKSEFDPYYLIEFALGTWDTFLLPAKLVRSSNFARSKVGKFDYGFQFIFDHMPNEKARLSKSILNKKLSYLSVEQRR
ncbi:MAG: hypothetical protein FWH33_04375 [Oscillospiraceae bacterium]|nr:hypothetical protein [Oscillospiraceae bacterium]